MVNPSKNQKKDARILPLGAFKVYMDLAPTSPPWPPQNTHKTTKRTKSTNLLIPISNLFES
jgi:hypothetical protein